MSLKTQDNLNDIVSKHQHNIKHKVIVQHKSQRGELVAAKKIVRRVSEILKKSHRDADAYWLRDFNGEIWECIRHESGAWITVDLGD